MAGQRPLETELSDIIGRVVTGTIAEAHAAVARSRAADQVVLEAARAALEEQTHRNDGLKASLLQSESLIEELRLKLQVERDNTKAATDACEAAQQARAEAAVEAETARQQLVAAYESRLDALQTERDEARGALNELKQRYEVEAAGRARATAALQSIQQTCALVESQASVHDVEDQLSAPARDDCAPEHQVTETAVHVPDGEPSNAITSAPGRGLKLVAPSEVTPVEPPPHLAEYLGELFDQIKAMYIRDLQAHAMFVVVDRLGVNVRRARDLFVQRASVDGLIGADLFDQALTAKLNEFGGTSLGRHLSIVAYELAHPDRADVRAEAS